MIIHRIASKSTFGLFRTLFAALCVTALMNVFADRAYAQFTADLLSVTPGTSEVTELLPPLPQRLTSFGFQGSAGTTYQLRFLVSTEPSLVVGVGAEIRDVAFDPFSSEISLAVEYLGRRVLNADDVDFPSGTFMVVFDPGVTLAATSSKRKGTARTRAAAARVEAFAAEQCYGPGAEPSLYKEEGDDFGGDDGLAKPLEPTDADTTVGLPAGFSVSTISTDSFFWCVIPPQVKVPGLGVRLAGPAGSEGALGFQLSADLVNFTGSDSPARLAIFASGAQVSLDVSATDDGGALTRVGVPFVAGITKVNPVSFAPAAPADPKADLVNRAITLAEREPITLVPENLRIDGKKAELDGTVDDLSLVGRSIEILRLDSNSRCRPIVSAGGGIVIARTPIKPDGTYSVNVPTKVLFPNNAKRTTIAAQVSGDLTRRAREISLSNANRRLRR